MNVLSLFSGVGGFDLGLEASGMKTIYQCEWDKHATNILENHWPKVPRWGDISTLTGKEILRHGQFPDVVAWGSPCQDLSVAGARKGLQGERSGLFHEGIRIIKELRKETNNVFPRFSIWENVRGALSSNGGADFGVILNEMANAGAMVIEWVVLDAQYFGVPQRRRRVFVIAVFDSAVAAECPNPLLPVAEGMYRNIKKGRQEKEKTADKASDSIRADSEWWNGDQIAATLSTKSDCQRMPDKDKFQAIIETNPKRLLGSQIIGSLNATDYKGPQNQQLDENKFIVEELVMSVRRLTPLECERLMGWPDDHTRFKADGSEQADIHRFKQCGNGVASPVAKWVGEQLMKLDSETL